MSEGKYSYSDLNYSQCKLCGHQDSASCQAIVEAVKENYQNKSYIVC